MPRRRNSYRRNRRSRGKPQKAKPAHVYTYGGVMTGTFTGQALEVQSVLNLDTIVQALVDEGEFCDIAYAKLFFFGIGTATPIYAKIYDFRYQSSGTVGTVETASTLERDQFDAFCNVPFEYQKIGELLPKAPVAYVGNAATVQFCGTTSVDCTKSARASARTGESVTTDEPKHDVAMIFRGTVGNSFWVEFRLEIAYNKRPRRLSELT